jgi:hypothetical protein
MLRNTEIPLKNEDDYQQDGRFPDARALVVWDEASAKAQQVLE